MAPEVNDVRVLIPRVRRALEGPLASGATSTLDDEQVKALVADAIAEVIFFTGGAFSHTLDVTVRDDSYGAPEEWAVNPPLSEAEASVIAAQAAINYFFFGLRDVKTQETIRDEGAEWSYTISATLLRDHLSYLMKLRDQALQQVQAEQSVSLDAYVSLIESRDSIASAYMEPWVHGSFGGQELMFG